MSFCQKTYEANVCLAEAMAMQKKKYKNYKFKIEKKFFTIKRNNVKFASLYLYLPVEEFIEEGDRICNEIEYLECQEASTFCI